MQINSFTDEDDNKVVVGSKVTIVGYPEDWSATVDHLDRRGSHITVHLNTGQSSAHHRIRLIKG